jgi:DNA-directed RNA polymerase specialized sigma24 family protein
MLVHLALDEGKRRTRRRAELSEAAAVPLDQREDDAAVRVLGRVEASADLMQALAGLPPRQRVALVLRYFEDLSEADVAEAMGCSVGTVKSTTSRALERLRGVVDVPVISSGGNGNGNGKGIDTQASIDLNLHEPNDPCVVAQDARTNEGSITS